MYGTWALKYMNNLLLNLLFPVDVPSDTDITDVCAFYATLNGVDYCYNGGTCRNPTGNVLVAECDCVVPYVGRFCEEDSQRSG